MDSGDSHYMIHTNSKIAQKYGTQSTNKSKHKQTLVLTYQTRGTAAPQGISTNITTRLIHILPSFPQLLNKTHPTPDNQRWVLINMTRSHRKNNHKEYPRVINSPQSTTKNDQLHQYMEI